MFVTIFGLPPTIKYQELKSLIKQQCNLIDIIVDNIIPTPDGSKKVRIGLADDGEAMKLIKGLDGFRMQGNQVIKVVPVNKTTSNTQQGFSAQQYPQATDFRNQGSYGGPNRTMDSMNRPQPWGPEVQSAWSLNPSMGQAQNSFGYAQTGYGQQQQFQPQRPDAPFPQGRPPMDQYRGKPNVPDNRRPVEPRSHTLRSIEIIDSPAMAPPGQQSRYPPGPVKDVIPGPRWEVPANQGPSQYQGQSHKEPSHWAHQDSGHFNDERRGLLDKRDPKMTPQMRIQDIKNYDKDPFPQQKPSPGRPEMGGRMTQGRPVSPRYAGRPVSPSRPGTHGRKSPIRLGMDGRQLPARPGMDGRQSPGRPGMHGRQSPSRSGMDGRQSPGRLGMHSRTSPGRQGGRPMSPRHGRMMSPDRGRMGRPVSPRTGRMDPGIQGRHSPGRMPSGRTRSPKNYPEHGRPLDGRPGMGGAHISPERQHGRPMSPVRQMPGRSDSPRRQPGGRPMPPGKGSSPSRIILRPGSPGMRPGRPGSPSKPGTFSGRPISPGPRGMMDQRPGGRHGSPGARGARPGSPGKVGPFGRPVSPGRLNQRHGMGRPGSPGRFGGGISGSPRRPEHGRPSSPVRRQPSPHGRMPGPRGRSGSPVRRGSPAPRRMGDRVESPRRISPHRYSPGRHHPDKHGPYDHDPSKPARPAYDMASSKGMYQSGFRQNVPWQKDDKYPKLDDDRREGRIPPRGMEIEKRMITERKSRSPVRRDRSPLRDRFKRHSPSPRSPRRSWALEKRRSPEVIPPPPPVWPGQKRDDEQFPRRNIPDRMQTDEKTRHQPVWEIPSENKDIDRRREDRRPQADDRKFPDKGDRRDIVNRELRGERFAPQNERSEKFSPKFSPREFDDRCDFHPNEEKRFNERQDRRDLQRRSIDREDRHREEIMPRPRNASPHHMDEQNVRRNFDKELEDIYKKAVEFRKKTEELRRSGERRREGYGEDGREYKESAFDHPRRPSSPSPREYRGSPSKDRRPVVRDKVEWKTGTRPNLPEHIKAKREKATNEIVNRLLERQTVCDYIEGDFEQHVKEELKIEISKIIQTIFGNDDVAYIEIIIKYQAKFSLKDEELMLRAVLNCLPTPTKTLKRSGPETSEVAAKTARRSSPTHIKKETSRPKLSDANTVSWSMNIEPPKLATVSGLSNPIANPQMGIYNTLDMSQYGLAQSMFMENNQQAMFMNQNLMATQQMAIQFNNPIAVNEPAMVPAPYVKPAIENKQEAGDEKDVFSLYLCHEDFQPFTLNEANELKRFLFSKIVEVTETSRGGWAPDIIIKGLQSNHRYELQTKDSISRDWLLDLNFRELSSFNLVIYTKEELWYERAAIWLPGHSRNRKIEPIEKLKLQNNKLNNINIGKWKLVKKIVNDKGTRLFVDMPPASARALDKYKMMLSYELQKVNVFRKATAVDKNAFDETMKEISAIDTNSLYKAAQNAPLPIINDHSMVKITLKNCKTLSIEEAHKIKEVLIYNIFRYHQMHGTSRTDFVKYGFCKPKYFGVVPENIESKQWLLSRNFGKLKDKDIIVVCDEDDKGKLFPMRVIVDSGFSTIPNKILERVKSSNQGVKGLHFNRWKADLSSRFINEKLISLDIHVDIDSLETLKNLNYQLDYVTDLNKTKTITFKSSVPYPEFEKILKQYKTEMVDSYDVANMELDSDDENQDVICLN